MSAKTDTSAYANMITLSEVNGGDKNIAIPFGNKFLNVTYSQADYTPALEREMQAKVREQLPGNMVAVMLAKVLKKWDIVDIVEKGNEKIFVPVPLNADTLDKLLSIKAQSIIVDALAEDQRPNDRKSVSSDDAF